MEKEKKAKKPSRNSVDILEMELLVRNQEVLGEKNTVPAEGAADSMKKEIPKPGIETVNTNKETPALSDQKKTVFVSENIKSNVEIQADNNKTADSANDKDNKKIEKLSKELFSLETTDLERWYFGMDYNGSGIYLHSIAVDQRAKKQVDTIHNYFRGKISRSRILCMMINYCFLNEVEKARMLDKLVKKDSVDIGL